MKIETLQKANELNKKIEMFSEALNCFEWQPIGDHGNKIGEPVSLNPKIVIEFDGCDGREQIYLPMNLSDDLIYYLKEEIIKGKRNAEAEFSCL